MAGNVMNIDKLEAGRELDALVAECWGWKPHQRDDIPNWVQLFSTDIAAAWLVVEKMHELGFRTDLESGWENPREYFAWKCRFYKPHYLEEAHAETAPLAICRAALKAVERYVV